MCTNNCSHHIASLRALHVCAPCVYSQALHHLPNMDCRFLRYAARAASLVTRAEAEAVKVLRVLRVVKLLWACYLGCYYLAMPCTAVTLTVFVHYCVHV